MEFKNVNFITEPFLADYKKLCEEIRNKINSGEEVKRICVDYLGGIKK